MKPRKYFNLCVFGDINEPARTIGYPLALPNLDGIAFAIVRPFDCLFEFATKEWQVIHVRTGRRVTYRKSQERTKAAAKQSAMAELERVGKKIGWEKMVRKLKRAKTPCIVAALENLEHEAEQSL